DRVLRRPPRRGDGGTGSGAVPTTPAVPAVHSRADGWRGGGGDAAIPWHGLALVDAVLQQHRLLRVAAGVEGMFDTVHVIAPAIAGPDPVHPHQPPRQQHMAIAGAVDHRLRREARNAVE